MKSLMKSLTVAVALGLAIWMGSASSPQPVQAAASKWVDVNYQCVSCCDHRIFSCPCTCEICPSCITTTE